jgi:predicted CoA-binding protein
MNLEQVMSYDKFVVLGDTVNPAKYASKIKTTLLENGYTVYCVGKELQSINDISEDIEIIDLCIHPAKGITLLKECNKKYKGVVIQPGAGSQEIIDFLKEENIPYVEGCVLIGMREFPRNK